MVSTIANGGIYLPPHVLLPGQTDGSGKTPTAAQPFKLGGDLPNPLPPGAHRVLSTLTAAEMRKMMEGVVLYGTGRGAQLNGYSSGGKTGTAQKVDPATHLYSKTMHIASFAGIAPINNPVIAVAVVIDNPKGGSYYGAAVSAPVFADVAQQVLEYLAVPHDIDLRPVKPGAKPSKPVVEDASEHTGDINALFSAVNDLPADDPLRAPPNQSAAQPATGPSQTGTQPANPGASVQTAVTQTPAATTVTIVDGKTLRVPSLIGLPVRKVIEQATAAGLEVQITGTGTVREQAPAAGTMVAPGTKIVVRCGR
jgi:cell division protein FtsI (penicillin-binding protein 3)